MPYKPTGRPRGRPRKNPLLPAATNAVPQPKRPRGRPRKNPISAQISEPVVLRQAGPDVQELIQKESTEIIKTKVRRGEKDYATLYADKKLGIEMPRGEKMPFDYGVFYAVQHSGAQDTILITPVNPTNKRFEGVWIHVPVDRIYIIK